MEWCKKNQQQSKLNNDDDDDVDNYDDDDDDDDGDDDDDKKKSGIGRCNSRLFTIYSQCYKLFPIAMMWYKSQSLHRLTV